MNVEAIDFKPYWAPDAVPEFIKRTDTQYSKIPHAALAQRQIGENRLLNSLLQFLPDGAVIAGGFMTSVMAEDKKAKDIDIFFTSEKAFRETLDLLINPDWVDGDNEAWAWGGYKLDSDEPSVAGGASNLRFVKFTHATRPPIQLVKLVWYDSPEHVIDSFDLTISQFAATNEALYANPLSFYDLVRKRIVLHRMQFPASTLRRLVKYAGKGYYACPGALVTIAEEINRSMTENPTFESVVYVD